MAAATIFVWFRREDYDAFKRLIPNDPDLPDTFDEWLNRSTQRIAEGEAHGITYKKIIVNPDKYARYCRASNLETNRTTLGAYAVVVDYRGE